MVEEEDSEDLYSSVDPRFVEKGKGKVKSHRIDKYALIQQNGTSIFCVDQDTGKPISKMFQLHKELFKDYGIVYHDENEFEEFLCKKYKI